MLEKIQKKVEGLRVKVYAGQNNEDTEKCLYEIEQMIFKAMDEALKISSKPMLADSLPLDKCTRLEVINHKDQDKLGRAYVHWKDDNKIEGSLQDGGRTLKLFITKR